MGELKKLIIVQMNDSHSYFELHLELFWENGQEIYRLAGGYVRMATLLKEMRAPYPGQVYF